jgi:uncharacterized protein
MKTIVIYHRADFDGIFCREIARKFLPDAELIGWDYGDPEPAVPKDCRLYIMDLSVPGLMGHPNLVWIDHHKSAIDKYPASIPGYRIDGVSACRLAWQWFNNPLDGTVPLPDRAWFIERKVSEPFAVRLAGEYDIWDKRDPRAELFQHSLRGRELFPDTWLLLLSEGESTNVLIGEMLSAGRSIQFATNQQNESIIKAAGFDLEFEGLKFLACNHARYNSHLFTAGLKPEHDACFGFCWRDGKWTVSLYHAPGKEHHDLSAIAAKYGGGGHRGACGFRCDTLPFFGK